MRPPRRQHPAFDTVRDYAYPEHLRASLQDMPAAPGVYVFHGQENDLPLYIGKSINLRSRVLAHLRNPQEARMLRQTTRISYQRTAGEMGALLLEAQWIKQRYPLFNQKLRRNRQLCSLRLGAEGVPEVVHAQDIDFAREQNLFGLYANRTAALEGLRVLAENHHLCLGVLGLEKLAPGRGCFRSMLRQCAGACCGRESAAAHQQRLRAALEAVRLACWPYRGAIGLVEEDGNPDVPMTQIHVVRNWCYLGSVEHVEQAHALQQVVPGFDADGYKILCKPVLSGQVRIIEL